MTPKNNFIAVIALVALTVASTTKPMNAQFARNALHYGVFLAPAVAHTLCIVNDYQTREDVCNKHNDPSSADVLGEFKSSQIQAAKGGIVATELIHRGFTRGKPATVATFAQAAKLGGKKMAGCFAIVAGIGVYNTVRNAEKRKLSLSEYMTLFAQRYQRSTQYMVEDQPVTIQEPTPEDNYYETCEYKNGEFVNVRRHRKIQPSMPSEEN